MSCTSLDSNDDHAMRICSIYPISAQSLPNSVVAEIFLQRVYNDDVFFVCSAVGLPLLFRSFEHSARIEDEPIEMLGLSDVPCDQRMPMDIRAPSERLS